jgi:hypothetical protein
MERESWNKSIESNKAVLLLLLVMPSGGSGTDAPSPPQTPGCLSLETTGSLFIVSSLSTLLIGAVFYMLINKKQPTELLLSTDFVFFQVFH